MLNRVQILLRTLGAMCQYNILSGAVRLRAICTLICAMCGIALVNTVILSVAQGINDALTSAADADLVVMLAAGAHGEMDSSIPRVAVLVVETSPEVQHGEVGALVSPEVIAIVNRMRSGKTEYGSLAIRGVTPRGFAVWDDLRVLGGRRFEFGRDEAIVGLGVQDIFDDLGVGSTVRLGTRLVRIVGTFAAPGSPANSEVWTAADLVQDAFGRGSSWNSLRVRLNSEDSFWDLEGTVLADPQLDLVLKRESEYYQAQANVMGVFVGSFGWLVVAVMGVGVVFITLNCTYTAVASRATEMATLRALGFGRMAVALGVVIEAMTLSALGVGLGVLVAFVFFDGLQATTTSLGTLNQFAFRLKMNSATVVNAGVLGVILGCAGAIVPAMSAVQGMPGMALDRR